MIFDERDNFEITILDGIVKIKGSSDAATDYRLDTITLTNVETIIFSDQIVQVSDLTNKLATSRLVDGEENDNNDTDTDIDTNDSSNEVLVLPDDDQWMNDFEISMIDLPISTDDIDHGLIDPCELINDLILIEDSMELNFDLFSDDDALIIGAVKPISQAVIDNDSMIPWENINDQAVWEDWSYQSL